MIDELKPYPEYKDSGVEWLGEVPAHWEVLPVSRLGRLFKGNGGSKEDEVDEGIPCVRYGDLYTQHEYFIRRAKACIAPGRAHSYTALRYGDVLFAASGEAIDEIGRSAVNLLKGETRCGGDVLVLRPTLQTIPEFLGYASDSPASRTQKAVMGRGFTVVHIYASQLKRLLLALPPLPEQTAIVRFLDYVDRRVRRVVRARRRLVALLTEYKQALIHEAVTGRIDVRTGQPYPEYKDSGVEWLGEVPAHWEVVRNKSVCRLGTGHTPSRKVAAYWVNCTVPWFTLSDVHQIRDDRRKYVSDTKEKVSEVGLANSAAVKLPKGTVILSRTASVGFSAILGAEMATSQDFMAWTPGDRVAGEFLLAVLRGMRPEFKRLMYGSTHNTIYMPTLHSFRMPLPPLPEQTAIVGFLDEQTGNMERAIEAARREIDLLNEFRTRLIADVVTGKLDVREVAARLPEEGDELEPRDELETTTEIDETAGDLGDLPLGAEA